MYDKPISYSGLSLYNKCPKKWAWSYILGNREPSGAAAERGTMLHDLLEKYFKDLAPYPTGQSCLVKWQPYMKELKDCGLVAEGEVAVFEDWTPAKFDDPMAWARGKIDGETDDVYDWKSGKIYDDHWMQGLFYCAMRDKRYAHFVYLDIPLHVESFAFSTDEVQDARGQIDDKIRIIRADEEWAATPSQRECGWCKLSWRNGGSCTSAP